MQTKPLNHIRIATRESHLALWQSEHVAAQLRAKFPDITVELVPMTTKGDQLLDTPLAKIGGKGLFIKELEHAMLEGRADIAVHSMKDVGIYFPEGYGIAAILKRENPFDAFVSNHFSRWQDLPQGAKVGTCSLRRRMQLARLRPDLELLDLRGNVQTRLQKLDDGHFDAIILACAGLLRLGLAERITQQIPPVAMLPAIGQGAIGIECQQDSPVYPYIAALNDAETTLCVNSERIINQHLEGSCQVPMAAFATKAGETLHLRARIGMPDGSRFIEAEQQGRAEDFLALGEQVAQQLIAGGAREILQHLQP